VAETENSPDASIFFLLVFLHQSCPTVRNTLPHSKTHTGEAERILLTYEKVFAGDQEHCHKLLSQIRSDSMF
jgi:hypothetical protein